MVKGFLIDLEGTLIEGNKIIKGADYFIKSCKDRYKLKILSNTTNNTSEDIKNKLEKLGIKVDSSLIYTALDSIKSYLETNKLNSFLLTSNKTREILKDFFKEPYNAVIVTHARENFTYENINMAFRLIVDGAVFISSSLTRYFKDKDGLLSLDAGAFTYALMYATGKEPIILGKPSKDFFISSLKSISLDPQEVVMIGDDIENDIKPAIEMGIKTVLVKTGKFRDEDLLKGIKPNYVVNSISDVLDFIS